MLAVGLQLYAAWSAAESAICGLADVGSARFRRRAVTGAGGLGMYSGRQPRRGGEGDFNGPAGERRSLPRTQPAG
jgi:hypothetical protein